jgi:D-inositol-3-phosphate glycosyltransferase
MSGRPRPFGDDSADRGDDHGAIVETVPESQRPPVQLPAGFVDLPSTGSVVPAGVLTIGGWAATAAGPCVRVELTLNGRAIGRARLGARRPDVAQATGLPSAVLSGFELVVDLAQIGFSEQSAELGGHGVGPDGVSVPLNPVQLRVQGTEPRRLPRPPVPGLDVNQVVSRRQLLLPFSRRPGSAPVRVLTCTHDLEHGGAQLMLLDLMRQIGDQHNIEVAVLSLADGPVGRSFEQLGFEVHVSPAVPVSSIAEYESRMTKLCEWAATRRFDVALVNTMDAFPAADLCLRLGVPTAWAIHESYPLPMIWSTYPPVDPKVREHAEQALGAANALVFVCQATRECYQPYLPTTRCVTLRYGIDIDELDRWRTAFDAQEERRAQSIPADAPVLLCVGTIDPRKGQVPLIQAFAQIAGRHPGAILRLVGSLGNAYSESARLAAAAYGVEDRVRVEPVTPDVRPSYAAADLLVSASDVESLPRSMLEAMALGLPVLGTDIFGVPELITEGRTGWLCEPRDVQGLADALDRILSLEAGQRAQVARNARQMVEAEFRSDVLSEAWGELLYELSLGRSLSGTPF